MKKKYLIAIIIFISVAITFPFLFELLYCIGDKYSIIATHYSQSDVLAYSITVVGLTISIWAVFLAKSSNEIHMQVSHARTVSDNDKEAVYLEIINNSLFDCTVTNFSLTNKNQNYHISISRCAPFTIKAKSNKEFIIEDDTFLEHIRQIKQHSVQKNQKIFYEIRLSNNEKIILYTGDLNKYLEEDYNGQA